MSPSNRDNWVEVDAVLSGLVKGKDYGFADIISPDPPTESALCGLSVRGVDAPFNDPFRCFIEPSKNGRWRVSEIIIEGLPEDVEGMTGQLVHEREGKVRTVYAVPGPDLPPVPFRLFDKALWDADLADIDANAEVCFDARRDRSGYVITTTNKITCSDVS